MFAPRRESGHETTCYCLVSRARLIYIHFTAGRDSSLCCLSSPSDCRLFGHYSIMAESDSWEYRKLYANQASLADALGDLNGVALRLATELVAKKVVGKAVKDEADIRGPHVTEIMRVNPIIRAVLAQIKLDETVYEEFRAALSSPVVDVPERLVKKWVPAKTAADK